MGRGEEDAAAVSIWRAFFRRRGAAGDAHGRVRFLPRRTGAREGDVPGAGWRRGHSHAGAVGAVPRGAAEPAGARSAGTHALLGQTSARVLDSVSLRAGNHATAGFGGNVSDRFLYGSRRSAFATGLAAGGGSGRTGYVARSLC